MLIAVELDAPAGNAKGEARRSYLEAARRLRDAGADMLTIADNPCAVSRGDSVSLAILFSRESGMPILPHIACRDRNLLALKSALLALDIADMREALIVTGDPFRREDGESGLIRSFSAALALAERIAEWRGEFFSAPFRLSAALNINAKNFGAETRKAKRKEKAGVSRFFTQPALSPYAVDNLLRARAELDAEIIGGILPVVSQGNADFLARGEIPGIFLDPDLHRRYQGRDKAEAAELAVGISLEFADRMRAAVDGYCVITPFKRIDVVESVVRGLGEIAAGRESPSADKANARPGAIPRAELAS